MSAEQQDNRNGDDDRLAQRVADPDAYNQSRRLQEIHDARREFRERKRQAKQWKVESDINLRQYTQLLLEAFQSYFYELEGLMHRHSNGDFYLYEVELGEMDPLDKEETVEFTGLMSLAGNVPAVRVDGYTIRDKKARTVEKPVLVTAPESVVMRAYRRCNQFVAEAGLDADMEDETGDAGFDYSDILEEGPPGGSTPDIDAAEVD